MILVVDSGDKEHSSYVFQKLLKRRVEAVYFDVFRFPTEAMLAFNPDTPSQGLLRPEHKAPAVPISEIRSAYCRYSVEFVNINRLDIQDSRLRNAAYQEIRSAVGSFFRNLECFWVDAIEAFEQHHYKSHQLKLLKAAGLRVPNTIVTNDPQQLTAFFEDHNRQVVYKPCWFGAYTEKLTEADLKAERLQTLSQAPVLFQEYIPGTDVLVYLVGDEPFAAEMHSPTLDFRQGGHRHVKHQPIILPNEVVQQCITLAKTLRLNFAAIDLRRTPDGEFVFFEGNPSPIFKYFENVTGYPVGDRLVDLLVSKV